MGGLMSTYLVELEVFAYHESLQATLCVNMVGYTTVKLQRIKRIKTDHLNGLSSPQPFFHTLVHNL